MELEFCKYDGSTTAINPRIERCGEQLIMKLNEQNCDYFLLFSKTPEGRVDLRNEIIQKALMEKKDFLLSARNEILTENVIFSCIEWSDYRVNNYAVNLSNRIAEHTIIGCREEQGRIIIFMPDDDMSCTASVSLTVPYRISQVTGKISRRPFAKNVSPQTFFAVEFDVIADYQDGGIIYNLDEVEWDYPITRKMLENGRFYIEAGHGMPRFSATVSGLELRKL